MRQVWFHVYGNADELYFFLVAWYREGFDGNDLLKVRLDAMGAVGLAKEGYRVDLDFILGAV